MRVVIRKIDKALKQLYNLEADFKAEDFLITTPPNPSKLMAGNASLRGALYVKEGAGDDVSLGIYLNESVAKTLSSFHRWRFPWSLTQLDAFTVAAEEVSHFHYLLYHANRGRQVSQLELELQGEIDKFLLTFFSNKRQANADFFTQLLEQLFDRFRFSDHLTEEERERYRSANELARKFLIKQKTCLTHRQRHEKAFLQLRRFYRLNSSEKISVINAR